jgi:hypothetical protein
MGPTSSTGGGAGGVGTVVAPGTGATVGETVGIEVTGCEGVAVGAQVVTVGA